MLEDQVDGSELVQLTVLLPERSVRVAKMFLEFSLEKYVSCTSEHPIPQYENIPEIVCTSDDCLLSELERRNTEEYQAYWKTTVESKVKMAALFFSDDSSMIGVIVTPERLCKDLFDILVKNHNVQYGYIGGDEVPPLNRHDIANIALASQCGRVIQGIVYA